MSEDETTLEVRGLEQVLKALRAKPPVARVGILGSDNARSGKGTSNATIGAAHEFGTSKIPQRSFLRVPISKNLNKQIESSGALNKETLDLVLKTGSVIPWLTGIAILAQKIVLEAFDEEGPGWKAWAKGYENNTGMKLNDTGQLKRSISYEVKS